MASTNVKLSSGKELAIDLYKMTIAEWRQAFGASDEENDALIARCCGVTVDEVQGLPYPDYQLLVKSFLEAARNPLQDPS